MTTTDLDTAHYAESDPAAVALTTEIDRRLQAVIAAEEMWAQARYLAVEKVPCRECGGTGTIDGGSLGSICPECLGSRAEPLAGQSRPVPTPPEVSNMRAQLIAAAVTVWDWRSKPEGPMPEPEMPPWPAIEKVLEGAASASSVSLLSVSWRHLLPAPAASAAEDLPDDAVQVMMNSSVLPMALDDGSVIVVSSLAGGARGNVPADLHLTIRRPGRPVWEDETYRYLRDVDVSDRLLSVLEKLYASFGNQDTLEDWHAMQRDVAELLEAAGFAVDYAGG